MPRFRIAWLMVVVAFVALDLGAIRGLFGVRDTFSELVGVGALPMANLLAAGAILGASRRKFPLFLAGFEVFGSGAMLTYLTWAWLSPNSLTMFVLWLLSPFMRYFRSGGGGGPENYAIAIVLLTLPQVILALLGGGTTSFVGRRRRKRSERV